MRWGWSKFFSDCRVSREFDDKARYLPTVIEALKTAR